MQDRKINFTKKAIAEIPIPTTATTYHDTKTRGLKLIVRPTGVKTFTLVRKINGKTERITVGRFPDLTVEQARTRASQLD